MAWIAIEDATIENSCLQIMPGTHKKIFSHVNITNRLKVANEFTKMADPKSLPNQDIVSLEMESRSIRYF